MIYIISENGVFTVTDCKPDLPQYCFADLLVAFHDESLEGYCAIANSALELEEYITDGYEYEVKALGVDIDDYNNRIALEFLADALNEYLSL